MSSRAQLAKLGTINRSQPKNRWFESQCQIQKIFDFALPGLLYLTFTDITGFIVHSDAQKVILVNL